MVECDLPKVEVAGSSPVSRSNHPLRFETLKLLSVAIESS